MSLYFLRNQVLGLIPKVDTLNKLFILKNSTHSNKNKCKTLNKIQQNTFFY